MNSLFIEYKNDVWCLFVVHIGCPALISFYCVCVVSFDLSLSLLFLCILLSAEVLR